MIISSNTIEKIKMQYETNMNQYPAKKQEVDTWILHASVTESWYLQFLYAFMPVNDIVSYRVEEIADYAKATIRMEETSSYAHTIPEEIFLSYVLSYRVNNENLDGSRMQLYSELAKRVESAESMTQAALEVNYWCYEKATYIPSDGRTIAPLTMCHSARGRCGEESTLAVSAMRSVGIPARQCYVPRWAHCDDNHAWVEVWVDGDWHYLGACEPEPVLDKGWFTSAASKAMLVHAKAYSNLLNGEEVAYQTPLYALINHTAAYGACRRLRVMVTNQGKPAEGLDVSFELINYSELFSLYQEKTNAQGCVEFETGLGDLYIRVSDGTRLLERKVDVRKTAELVMDFSEAWEPGSQEIPKEEFLELVPPAEKILPLPKTAQRSLHQKKLAACDAIREAYVDTFVKQGTDEVSRYLAFARGNRKEIEAFMTEEEFSLEDKLLLLQTLREKDFMDITSSILCSYLRAALPYRGEYQREIYQNYILAPRVAMEMIEDIRGRISSILEERGEKLVSAAAVWDYMNTAVQKVDSYGVGNWTANAAGAILYGICDKNSFDNVFVQVCRAIGIPARLNPVTGEPEEVLQMEDGEARFLSVKPAAKQGKRRHCQLTLKNGTGKPAQYFMNFSLGRFQEGGYQTLHYFDLVIDKEATLELEPGEYRLITTNRKIDGSISACLESFHLEGNMTVRMNFQDDFDRSKLKSVQLSDAELAVLVCSDDPSEASQKQVKKIEELYRDQNSVLVFAEPGKEPTEHLFQEFLECEEAYARKEYHVLVVLSEEEGVKNQTLQRVLHSRISVTVGLLQDEAYLHQLHEEMGVGDERLPFAIAISKDGRARFAFANYNIRTAQSLMEILDQK